MNTVNTTAGLKVVSFRLNSAHAAYSVDAGAGDFVFSGVPEYIPPVGANAATNAENRPESARHAPVVCIVFRCIQRPSAYKFGP